jgi:N-acetyl sugar amidotransferase
MKLQTCTKCVYDTTVGNITFDSEGICNYCRNYERLAKKYINIPQEVKTKELDLIVSKIKNLGKGKPYDCILGLSGGVDSSYLAWMAKDLGLRPLLVHFDNGWNSELAVKNIENIINILNYDLNTYVFNWEEFKDLQVAYLKAGVVDIEVPTDYLIFAVLNRLASKHNIKYILSGYNYATEFGMPKGWNISNKFDHVNLKNIHDRFGKVKLKNFPKFGRYQIYYYNKIRGVETTALLNYITYVKADVKEFIIKELKWQDYGGKHHESIFTRFYQDYILPKKFGIDKRKAHWSALICSGQATRQEALEAISQEPYPLESQLQDREYVTKKLRITDDEFEQIMKSAPVPHEVYGMENKDDLTWKLFLKLMWFPAKVLLKLRHIRAVGRWR